MLYFNASYVVLVTYQTFEFALNECQACRISAKHKIRVFKIL